ncbi:MAG: hypothetical protein VB092_02115 [Oscillospiraceae bacterium]|nr:hypothetical protein [Oscillospiraceae bacterium]
MTRKRVYILFFILVLFANIVMLRLFTLMSDADYAAAVESQSTYTQKIASLRPDFYDCSGRLLTGVDSAQLAVAVPGDTASWSLRDYVDESGLAGFDENMLGSLPFTVRLSGALPDLLPVDTVAVSKRYGGLSLARHLIGYLDYENRGVTGLESVFETYLSQNTVSQYLQV